MSILSLEEEAAFSMHTTEYAWRLCMYWALGEMPQWLSSPEHWRKAAGWGQAQQGLCLCGMTQIHCTGPNLCGFSSHLQLGDSRSPVKSHEKKKGLSTGCRVQEKSTEVSLGVSPHYKRKNSKSQMGWDRVWRQGDQSLHWEEMPTGSTCLWSVPVRWAAWDSRVAELKLAGQCRTKQLQVNLRPGSSQLQGIRELKLLSSFLSTCNTYWRMTPKLGTSGESTLHLSPVWIL